MNEWYVHNLESVSENETQTDHLISAKWPEPVIVKKKKEREREPAE